MYFPLGHSTHWTTRRLFIGSYLLFRPQEPLLRFLLFNIILSLLLLLLLRDEWRHNIDWFFVIVIIASQVSGCVSSVCIVGVPVVESNGLSSHTTTGCLPAQFQCVACQRVDRANYSADRTRCIAIRHPPLSLILLLLLLLFLILISGQKKRNSTKERERKRKRLLFL